MLRGYDKRGHGMGLNGSDVYQPEATNHHIWTNLGGRERKKYSQSTLMDVEASMIRSEVIALFHTVQRYVELSS